MIQFLINNIPYHTHYHELFAGSAQLFRAKKPASVQNRWNDINPDVTHELCKIMPPATGLNVCALWYMEKFNEQFDKNHFIYLDPPYPLSSRRNNKSIYKFMMTDDDHVQLLTAIQACSANIMISTRANEIYDSMLKDWRRREFSTIDHAGPCVEIIYMNYPEPKVLHQYDMLGDNHTHRQQIKRKIQFLSGKFNRLPVQERNALLHSLVNQYPDLIDHFLSIADHAKTAQLKKPTTAAKRR